MEALDLKLLTSIKELEEIQISLGSIPSISHTLSDGAGDPWTDLVSHIKQQLALYRKVRMIDKSKMNPICVDVLSIKSDRIIPSLL
jgi:hypothetical protein